MPSTGVHPTALLAQGAKIGARVSVGAFAVIGDSEIDDGTIIQAHVVIGDGVRIGQDVEIFPGAMIGKEPKSAGATARPIQFRPQVVIGDRCSIGPHSTIYYDVEIGTNSLIGDGASIREQGRIGSRCIISRHVSLNYNVRVGDRVKVMDGTHLTGGMVVGNGAFISALVVTLNDNVVREGFGEHISAPIVEEDAVVGGGATLMPGIIVGRGAMVAAGAVVTKNVEPGGRVAGVPARPF